MTPLTSHSFITLLGYPPFLLPPHLSSSDQARKIVDVPPNIIKGLRLDNMVAQSLTWLDMAIVFGPHIPLLVPLLLVSLVTNRWAHEAVGLRRLGLRETRAELSKPSTWYVLFSVVCQQVLTAAVFLGVNDNDTDFSGTYNPNFEVWIMTAVMVVVAMLCIAVAVVPVQWLEDAGRRCCRCACTTTSTSSRHQRREGNAGGNSSSSRSIEAERPAGTQMVVSTNRGGRSSTGSSIFGRRGSVDMVNPLEASAVGGSAGSAGGSVVSPVVSPVVPAGPWQWSKRPVTTGTGRGGVGGGKGVDINTFEPV